MDDVLEELSAARVCVGKALDILEGQYSGRQHDREDALRHMVGDLAAMIRSWETERDRWRDA